VISLCWIALKVKIKQGKSRFHFCGRSAKICTTAWDKQRHSRGIRDRKKSMINI